MRRIACIYVPTLFLQRLMHKCPAWRQRPVAVVAGSKPTAPIIYLNSPARALHLQEGMSLSAAQSMVHALEVAQFDSSLEAESINTLWQTMLTLTPGVEPDASQSGVLWLDPNGLEPLFGSLTLWAAAVQQAVVEVGYLCCVVVGFNRYLTLALARTRGGCHVMPDAQREALWARAAPLAALGITPSLRIATDLLGLRTLGDLLQFDASTLRQRLGAEAEWIYRMALGLRTLPLRPKAPVAPCTVSRVLEPPETDLHRLLFVIKTLLAALTQQARSQRLAVQSLHVQLTPERHAAITLNFTPAAPTCDIVVLLNLVRLRLTDLQMAAPVCQVHNTAQTVAVSPQQMPLLVAGLQETPKVNPLVST